MKSTFSVIYYINTRKKYGETFTVQNTAKATTILGVAFAVGRIVQKYCSWILMLLM